MTPSGSEPLVFRHRSHGEKPGFEAGSLCCEKLAPNQSIVARSGIVRETRILAVGLHMPVVRRFVFNRS